MVGKLTMGPSRESEYTQRFEQLSTGSPALDDILAGGLPAGRTHLLTGTPGTGKTTAVGRVIGCMCFHQIND
jgi:RecA/RadA recombinase